MPAVAEIERGLPANVDAEKLILGSVLLDGRRFVDLSGNVQEDDFALEKHRRIWRRMIDLFEGGVEIDRVTVANELIRRGELESVDGLSYLVSLDDGLPQISNLESYVRIVNECARGRRLAMLGQHMLNASLHRVGSDEIIKSSFSSLIRLSENREKSSLQKSGSVLENFEGGLNGFLSPSLDDDGLKTGFLKLDEMTGGMHPGELIIIAARPSMGKTALALQIGIHTASRGTPVAVFSLEMEASALLRRAVCSLARVDSQRFRLRYVNTEERLKLRAAADKLHKIPLYIDSTPTIGIPELHSGIRRVNAEREAAGEDPVGLVIVDYLQLMEVGGGRGNRSRNEDVSALSRGLKLLARDFNIPVIALSQLSRGPETRTGDHRPVLADLRDSGAIEQDADLVGFVFRPEVYQRDRDDLKGIAELILAKQRNGPIGKVDLIFLHSQVRFENRAEDLGDFNDEG